MSEKDAIAKSPRGRTSRTPIGTRNVLTVKGQDPNYVYRVVNDEDGRIEQFKEAGYEEVLAKDVKVGDKRINATTPEGSVAQMSVGSGTKAIVMRIRRDWYEEDQALKQKQVDKTEADMKRKALDGTYGTFEIERK
jgi:hypothetical protein